MFAQPNCPPHAQTHNPYPQTKELGQGAVDRTELEDPYISGIYLIIGVRHDIQNGQHSMTLTLMKDSLGDF